MNSYEKYLFSKARSTVYAMLSLCFYYPSKEVDSMKKTRANDFSKSLKTLSLNPFFKGLDELGIHLTDDLKTTKRDKLEVEYTRLFISTYPSVPCPPYESYYKSNEKLLMREEAVKINKLYREYGVDLSEKFNEPPDHIALELEFMHFLSLNESRYWKEESIDDAIYFLRGELEILSTFLATWVHSFSECIKKHAKLSFYKELSLLTRKYVEEDFAFVRFVSGSWRLSK